MALSNIKEEALMYDRDEAFTEYPATLDEDHLNNLKGGVGDKTAAPYKQMQERLQQNNYHFWDIFSFFVKIKELVNNNPDLPKTPNHGDDLDALEKVLEEKIEAFLKPEETAGANPYSLDNLIELLNTVPDEQSDIFFEYLELNHALDILLSPDQIAGIINHLEPERQEAFCCFVRDRYISGHDAAFDMDDFITLFDNLKGNPEYKRTIYDSFENSFISLINSFKDLMKIQKIPFLDPQRKAAILEEKAALISPQDPYIRCVNDLACLFDTFNVPIDVDIDVHDELDKKDIMRILMDNKWFKPVKVETTYEVHDCQPLANITQSRKEFAQIYNWLDLSKDKEILIYFLKALNENNQLTSILGSPFDFHFFRTNIGLENTLSLYEMIEPNGYRKGIQTIYDTCLDAMRPHFIGDKSAAFKDVKTLLQEIEKNPQGLIAKAHKIYFKHLLSGVTADNNALVRDIENLCIKEMGFIAFFKSVNLDGIRQSLSEMATPKTPLLLHEDGEALSYRLYDDAPEEQAPAEEQARLFQFQSQEKELESSGLFSSFSGFNPFSR